LKDGAKLFAYFFAVIIGGALLAPPLFWSARHVSPFFAKFDFDSFFHRALLICAIAFLWPLLRLLRLHSLRDLQLDRNRNSVRDAIAGFLLASLPLLICAFLLIATRIFVLKTVLPWSSIIGVIGAAIAVPLIEELFFRGLILGILLRDLRPIVATLVTSAFFALLHFLKAPGDTNDAVTWFAGFRSIANSFAQFADPTMVLALFATLFLIGWILADARLRTRSLFLPIGLHSGWILVAGVVGKLTRRATVMLPWLGTSLLIGLLPLALGLITWVLMIVWLRYADRSHT
jgi:membrane protease YdiL (CAAX protease family)